MSNLSSQQRQLSVYERQQLLKANLSEKDFLAQGEMPVEYFTGQVDFANLVFKISPAVLIPRVETEELVNLAWDFLKKVSQAEIKVLEVATGSGVISLALLNQLINSHYLNKSWQFVATDLAVEALAVARENYQNLLAPKVDPKKVKFDFLLSDLLSSIKSGQQFDLIVANLPYIADSEMARLDKSVKDFEPHLALAGGPTGFELIEKMINQLLAGSFLAQNGQILLEVDQRHDLTFIKKHYSTLLEQFRISTIKDQFQRQRFLSLKAL